MDFLDSDLNFQMNFIFDSVFIRMAIPVVRRRRPLLAAVALGLIAGCLLGKMHASTSIPTDTLQLISTLSLAPTAPLRSVVPHYPTHREPPLASARIQPTLRGGPGSADTPPAEPEPPGEAAPAATQNRLAHGRAGRGIGGQGDLRRTSPAPCGRKRLPQRP